MRLGGGRRLSKKSVKPLPNVLCLHGVLWATDAVLSRNVVAYGRKSLWLVAGGFDARKLFLGDRHDLRALEHTRAFAVVGGQNLPAVAAMDRRSPFVDCNSRRGTPAAKCV